MRPFAFPGASANKYRNKKVMFDGLQFDSKKEAAVYLDLKRMKQCGEISDFKVQVTFELIPTQYEQTFALNKKGESVKKQKVIERPVTYTADFVVTYPDGEVVVIDAKGNKSLDAKYPIKRKMMLYFHKIRIKEV